MHAYTCVNRSPAINTGIQRGFSETTESGRLKHEVEVYALPLSEEALSACCLLSFHGVTFMK